MCCPSEISSLIDELIKNDDPRFTEEIYDVFQVSKNTVIKQKVLNYFKQLEDPCLEDYAVETLNDPYDENHNGYGGGNCDLNNALQIAKRAIWASGPETATLVMCSGTSTSRPSESVNIFVVASSVADVSDAAFTPYAEPAKIPIRCPLPIVKRESMARTPVVILLFTGAFLIGSGETSMAG